MTFRFLGLFFLSAVFASRAGAADALPLQSGEQLTFRVSWAIVRGAGEIKIDAHMDPVIANRLVVTTTTATRRLARMLMPFDAKAESVYDLATGQLVSIHESSDTRGKLREHTVTFDHPDRRASYVTRESKEPNLLTMPAGEPSDLIMALLKTRSWDLKPGESRDSLVLFDDEFYELTIHARGYESVTTPLGTFNTLVLEPRMEKTAPKGMFKRGSTVRVWISQDERRLPVRFAVEFNIGTGTATLEAYTNPARVGATGRDPANAKHPRP
jgi:hypothetical protein